MPATPLPDSLSTFLRPIGRDPGLLLAGLLALVVILPLLQPGLPGTADTPIHFYRALELDRSWAPGVVYPRWAPDLVYGYGYPLWVFVPPLPYVLTLAIHTLGLSLEASLKGVVMLTVLGYGVGAYLFVRDSLGPAAGLVAAAVYTLAPFALREVLLYGGNYPQYLAIALYPWLLWALRRVYFGRGGWLSILATAVLYAGLLLSHLFHALVATPVGVAYLAVLWLGEGRKDRRGLGAALLGLGLGLLATAFFWLPALAERSLTRFQEGVVQSISPFGLRFLSWGELLAWPQALDARAANPWVPFSLGPAALLLAGLGLLAILIRRPPGPASGPGTGQDVDRPATELITYQALFFLALLDLAVFMMLPASDWAWRNSPFLASAEFPWRWLGLANLSLAFLAGASVYWLSPRWQPALAGAALLAMVLASAVYLYPPRPFVRYGQSLVDMAAYEAASGAIGTTTLAEYLPRWVQHLPPAPGEVAEKLDRASLPEGASADLLEHGPVRHAYRLESSQPFRARFLTFYYPGWTAYLDGKKVDITIEPGSGLMTLPVPAGSHTLELRFRDTPVRAASIALSGLTVAAMAGLGLWQVARRRPAVGRQASGIDHQLSGRGQAWGPLPALLVGAGLVGLLLLKVLVVDPRSEWFRRQSPPEQVAGAGHALRVNLDERVWLLGYDVEGDHVRAWDALRVVLYWQAQCPLEADYRSFVHLDAPTDQRTWAGSDNFAPGDATAQIELPTRTWDTTHYVRDEHWLWVPRGVPPVSFNLRAGLYDPETGQRLPIAGGAGDTVLLQAVQVLPGRGLRPADVPNPLSYRLGEGLRLLGYEWDRKGGALSLYWQAEEAVPGDYVVFVHLLDGQGELAWGADGPPLGGLYPTSEWRPGDVVVDPRQLALDGLAPGGYTLAVGMYHPDTLARLPVSDARGGPVPGDAIPLAQVSWP